MGTKYLNSEVVAELDNIINKWSLHTNWDEPVFIEGMLEAYRAGYRDFEQEGQAVTYHWERHGLEYYRIVYDISLRAINASAQRRHAGGHEVGHIIAKHQGTKFELLKDRHICKGLQSWLDDAQEWECECIAAYLLVPTRALQVWRSYDVWYIARKLDVPEQLVNLRQEMLDERKATNRFGEAGAA